MRASETLFLLLWFFCIYVPTSFSTNVMYDHRALVIDGKRRVLVSGSVHYPRSTPEVLFITLFLCLCNVGCTLFLSFVFWSFELKGGVFVVADVARHHSKVQRWRTWCNWNLCFLELTRASSRPGPLPFSSVNVTITVTIFVLFLLFTVTCIPVCVCSFFKLAQKSGTRKKFQRV